MIVMFANHGIAKNQITSRARGVRGTIVQIMSFRCIIMHIIVSRRQKFLPIHVGCGTKVIQDEIVILSIVPQLGPINVQSSPGKWCYAAAMSNDSISSSRSIIMFVLLLLLLLLLWQRRRRRQQHRFEWIHKFLSNHLIGQQIIEAWIVCHAFWKFHHFFVAMKFVVVVVVIVVIVGWIVVRSSSSSCSSRSVLGSRRRRSTMVQTTLHRKECGTTRTPSKGQAQYALGGCIVIILIIVATSSIIRINFNFIRVGKICIHIWLWEIVVAVAVVVHVWYYWSCHCLTLFRSLVEFDMVCGVLWWCCLSMVLVVARGICHNPKRKGCCCCRCQCWCQGTMIPYPTTTSNLKEHHHSVLLLLCACCY